AGRPGHVPVQYDAAREHPPGAAVCVRRRGAPGRRRCERRRIRDGTPGRIRHAGRRTRSATLGWAAAARGDRAGLAQRCADSRARRVVFPPDRRPVVGGVSRAFRCRASVTSTLVAALRAVVAAGLLIGVWSTDIVAQAADADLPIFDAHIHYNRDAWGLYSVDE